MPPRISRTSSAPSSKPRTSSAPSRKPKKSAKRALDAFAIAAHEHPERIKIRKNRLGELEGPAPSRKRVRGDEEEEGEEEEEDGSKRRKHNRGDESVDEGSDSEGNTWMMGHVDDDGEDSDIDSDEAFGESDEERFEGWVFRGSASTQREMGRKKGRKVADADVDMEGEIDLNEGESADGEDEDEEDDFGDEGIDLATALDQYEDSEEEEERQKKKKEKKSKKKVAEFSDSEPSEEEDFAADGASDYSTSDEDSEEDEADKAARLQDLISSLPEDDESRSKSRQVEIHESGAPSEFGVMRKVDLASFKPKITDPEKRKSLKLLQDDLKPSKRNDIARKLDAPLPKRQQDKLDRAVANEKANETLSRWVDTVKQNRRAEHISFPLKSASAGESMGESRLMPTTTATPANDLESTIQSILQQSGLSTGKDDDAQMQKWEELQTNKLPLEEVAKRRALLRQERELLFREEVRAKRIKKIKSKAYRRVHRKERERLLQRDRDAQKADGVDVSEDEREYNDRRRAEERMGTRHRESKWAKGIKESGRAAWDEDARTGVTEMARRNEELRRRMEGKEVRDEDEEGSDLSSEEDEDEDEEQDADQVLQKQLGRLKQNPFSDGSKLGNMQFMQKAEAARKARNDEDIERMRRELAGEESNSDDEDENAARKGRQRFAPSARAAIPAKEAVRGEFEEMPGSDEEAEHEDGLVDEPEQSAHTLTKKTPKASQPAPPKVAPGAQNPYLTKAPKEKKSKEAVSDALWKAQDTILAIQEKPKAKSKPKAKPADSGEDENLPEPKVSAPDADGWQTVTYNNSDDEADIENSGIDLNLVLHNQSLTAQAFAGDNIAAEFATEKTLQISEESSKTVTTVLPGWGAWIGTDLTANEKKNKGKKTITKKDGIDPAKRKDAKLDRVIINEKKVKKNDRFLAKQLPFPFENKEQYERSLRLPKGPEWTTKMTFQEATKPRVLVKQGVIRPMRKPMV